MTGALRDSPAAARAGSGADAADRRQIADEPARLAAILKEIGPADPALEPGADLRRRLVRAART
ncbi:MAG: hypothetical protein OXC10_13955 [Rhodospirillaceae bacterium]|nr:hypothetical protein [Rhodospirillaceae bacterium]